MLTPADYVATGGELTPQTVLAAYRQGVFPWFPSDADTPVWWSPNPRFIIDLRKPDRPHVGRTIRKAAKKFRVTFDNCFKQVIHECSVKRYEGRDGTWITPGMKKVYTELYYHGHCHSVEVWENDILVGGLYGTIVGTTFSGESMFAHEPNASKVGFWTLCRHLKAWGVTLVDCQMESPVMSYFGAEFIPRETFIERLLWGHVNWGDEHVRAWEVDEHL